MYGKEINWDHFYVLYILWKLKWNAKVVVYGYTNIQKIATKIYHLECQISGKKTLLSWILSRILTKCALFHSEFFLFAKTGKPLGSSTDLGKNHNSFSGALFISSIPNLKNTARKILHRATLIDWLIEFLVHKQTHLKV